MVSLPVLIPLALVIALVIALGLALVFIVRVQKGVGKAVVAVQ